MTKHAGSYLEAFPPEQLVQPRAAEVAPPKSPHPLLLFSASAAALSIGRSPQCRPQPSVSAAALSVGRSP